MDIRSAWSGLRTLSVYKPLCEKPVLHSFMELLGRLSDGDGGPAICAYTDFFYALKSEGYKGLGDWLWDQLRFVDSPYGLLCERDGRDPDLERAAKQDVEALVDAASVGCEQVQNALSLLSLAGVSPGLLPRWQSGAGFDFDALTAFYRENGCGLFAKYRAFRWSDGQLWGIEEPDSPQPWEMWGYTEQRQLVRDNALALLSSQRVNHVLLYGQSGTGKSATVKSLLLQPGLERLRIIEMDKDRLQDIPKLVRLLEHRRHKFILFVDDLAFDADDKTYSQLKTILEGSLEKQRDNVVVYATSNRRNLVKQNFSDRNGDELDRNETIAEKTSLADRFGVRVAYFSLTPKEFLRMVADLAKVYSLELPPQELEDRARKWELRHPGRTPRVARQFIAFELERQQGSS